LDATNVGDEGGFAPSIQDNEEGLILLQEAIAKAGHTGKVQLGMDCAASEYYVPDKHVYDLDFKSTNNDGSKCLDYKKLIELYSKFASKYPIVSIEDPFDQDDWTAY